MTASRSRRGALLGALALACAPRCSSCEATTPIEIEPPPIEVEPAPLGDGAWSVQLDEGGRLRVRLDHTDLVTSAFRFGGPNGEALEQIVGPTVRDGDGMRFTVESPTASIRLTGRAGPTETPGQIEVVYTLHAAQAQPHVSGGGVGFTIRSDARLLAGRAADPVALPDGAGFTWDSGRGVVRFELEPTLPLVQLVRAESTMQCAFYLGRLDAGERTFELRITLPEGGRWMLPDLVRYATPDASWHESTLPWNDVPVDLAFLNDDDRPAGTHGPVRVDGERLLRGDGTPLRLWGTNIFGSAIFFADDAAIAAQAKRIAAFGYNLVRLHHHDSHWLDHNVFGRRSSSTRTLDGDALDRIDRWVAALAAEGVYVWIDLHVGRVFTPSDGIEAYDELDQGKPFGFNYVNPTLAAAMQQFARQYLDRENRHRGRRYVDDPAVVGLLVTNENDLTMHFGSLMVQPAGRPVHHGWLEARTRAFAERTGLDVPSPVEPWRLGATKLAMADIEAVFYRDAIADLRAFGWRGPVATSSLWGDDAIFALPSLTTGDVIDAHSYGGVEMLGLDPRVDPNFVHPLATAAVAGFPMTITEWNIPAPARDRFVGPTLVAATAALQGWDAPMHFAYVSSAIGPPQHPEIWSSWDDPALMAMMPAAALMFRRGDVAPARERYALAIDRAALVDRHNGAATLGALRTLAERSEVRLVLPALPELAWMRGTTVPTDATVLTTLDDDRLGPSATAVESDTGELRRDWQLGVHTVTTAANVAATGWLGGRRIELGDVAIELTTAKAAIALSSLDGAALMSSRAMLLASVAQVAPTHGNARPYLSEPVTGVLELRSQHAALVWTPLGARAGEAQPVRTQARDGVHRLQLTGTPVHFWRVTPPA